MYYNRWAKNIKDERAEVESSIIEVANVTCVKDTNILQIDHVRDLFLILNIRGDHLPDTFLPYVTRCFLKLTVHHLTQVYNY